MFTFALSPARSFHACPSLLAPRRNPPAIMADRMLRVRLGVARLELESAHKKECHLEISQLHKRATLELLYRARQVLNCETRALISGLVTNCKWWPGHNKEVLGALVPPAAAMPPKLRRAFQDYTMNVLEYFSEEDWEYLGKDDNSSIGKLDFLIGSALDLSMRVPSEPSLKFLTSLWISMTNTTAESARMSSDQKFSCYQQLKANWTKRNRVAAEPPDWIEVLPLPSKLRTDFKHTAEVFFAAHGDPPRRLPVNMHLLQALDASYSCRSKGGAACAAKGRKNIKMASLGMAGQMINEVYTNQKYIMNRLNSDPCFEARGLFF